MSQQTRLGRTATSVFTEDGWTKIIYHSTVVVKFNDSAVVLNSGGWKTATTKTRMNQAGNQFSLGYNVFQKDYEWFVRLADGSVIDYQEDMSIPIPSGVIA